MYINVLNFALLSKLAVSNSSFAIQDLQCIIRGLSGVFTDGVKAFENIGNGRLHWFFKEMLS